MYLKDKSVNLKVRISSELMERLVELSRSSGFSVSEIVRQTLIKL